MYAHPLANPHCETCSGAGFIHPRDYLGKCDSRRIIPCPADSCHQSRLNDIEGKLSFNPRTGIDRFMTFGSFEPRAGTKKALTAAKEFASMKGLPFLAILGPVGTGKTHLANAIALKLAQDGHDVKLWTVKSLLDHIKRGIEDNTADGRIREIKECFVLVLDDFKAEFIREWGVDQLEDIIDFRYRAALLTVLTTNNQLADLPERIEDRFSDRAISVRVVIEARSYRPVNSRKTINNDS